MELRTIEIKAFVPARDFQRSLAFYGELGFNVVRTTPELAHLRCGASSFLLQNHWHDELGRHFMMHLLVPDVDRWWAHVQERELVHRYGVRCEPPEDRPWGLRDFVLTDPSGVLWRVGQLLGGRGELSRP